MIISPRAMQSLAVSRQQLGGAVLLLSGTWALLLFRDYYFSVISLDATRSSADVFYSNEIALNVTITLFAILVGILLCADVRWKRHSKQSYHSRHQRQKHARVYRDAQVVSEQHGPRPSDEDTVCLDPPEDVAQYLLAPDFPGDGERKLQRIKIKQRIKLKVKKEKKV